MRVAAALLTAIGLAVLLWGTAKAAPLVFFATAEERAGLETGRRLMLVAAALLVVAAVLLAARGGAGRAVAVVSPAVVALALIYAFPKAAYTWAGVLVLGPVALVAALTALRG